MTIKNAEIVFKDFSNKRGVIPYPTFAVVIDESLAKELIKDGWNIKYIPSHDKYYIPVTISTMQGRLSPIFKVKNTKTNEYIDDLSILDECDLKDAEVTINPYVWNLQDGERHVKAYLGELKGSIYYDHSKRGEEL